jgi:hypothetical protein
MTTRVTADSALSIVHQLVADLALAIAAAGPLPELSGWIDATERLRHPDCTHMLDVTVVLTTFSEVTRAERVARPPVPARWASRLDDLLGSHSGRAAVLTGDTLRFRLADPPKPGPVRIGDLNASVLLWLVPDAAMPCQSVCNRLNVLAHDHPIVVLAAARGNQLLEAFRTRLRGSAWNVTAAAFEDLADTTLDDFVAQTIDGFRDLLRAEASARASSSLAAAVGAGLTAALRRSAAQRTAAQLRLARIQSHMPVAPVTEILGDVRATLQRSFGDFRRGVEERFARTFSPPLGSAWQLIEEQLKAGPVLQEDRRAKTTALHLAPDWEHKWLEAITSQIAQHCRADLVALGDLYSIATSNVERLLVAAGDVPVQFGFHIPAEERLVRLLQTHAGASRRYESEVPRAGAFEFLMIARRYQMVLFMFVSAFGLSFLRAYPEFMVPAAVLTLSFGALRVVESVRRDRRELSERELDKAREYLRSEARRTVVEVQRAWNALVSEHLNEQLCVAFALIEVSVRAARTRQAEAMSQHRDKVQRQLRGCDALERRLGSVVKGVDTVAQTIAQLRQRLCELAAPQARSREAV